MPFLRYITETPGIVGLRVEQALRDCLCVPPSFVAFERYGTILAVANMIRHREHRDVAPDQLWSRVEVEGTRGSIRFRRTVGDRIWLADLAPIQVVDRDPENASNYRVLHIENYR